ncbi:MAG: MgtC/SapB family protein [Prevotella sp.]|nr:MgtC/SapB family protein [Prevotella sp.]
MDGMLLEKTLRLVVALALGGVIGLEREFRAKDAGFRTHFLVAVGAALFTIISQYGFGADLKDSSRVAAQVVSGIGFLGAGLIVFQKNVVRGLTTAAGLWVTAAIGMACGTGMLWTACIVTALVLIGLEVLNVWIPQVGQSILQVSFSSPSLESVRHVVEEIRRDRVEIRVYELKNKRTSRGEIYEVNMDVKIKRGDHHKMMIDYLTEFEDVTINSIE